MVSPTRRGFLKSAASCSAMPFIAQLLKVVEPQTVLEPNPNSGELNLIFHGVFVFMYDQGDPHAITVYGPPVGDGSHVYWAGDWEQEDENVLSSGVTYELKGAFAQPGPPFSESETTYPVIQCANRPEGSKASCAIRVPIPHKIVGLRALSKQRADFFAGKYAPKRLDYLPLAYAYVYKYDATKAPRPQLARTSWIAPHRPGTVNLHIRGERPTVTDTQHQGFKAIQGFLGYGDKDISLNSEYADCMVGPDLFPRVTGVLPEEEYFLPELFPNQPASLPGSPQTCPPNHFFQPANCSSISGVLYPNGKSTSR